MNTLSTRELALVEVGRRLRDEGYQFTTVTPETHRRVNARAGAERAGGLRDVFGWSRPFDAAVVPAPILEALRRAEMVAERGGLLVCGVRFSCLGDGLYVHSAYPTSDESSVFFGPDTYRYCALLRREVTAARRVVDIGCGSGVGGLCLADRVDQIVLADINEAALSLARVNAELAGVTDRVEVVASNLFTNVHGDLDLVIANPPYLVDPGHRVYRDGGGELGTDLGVRIVRVGLSRLQSGGRLILYTGAPIVDGEDHVRSAIAPILDSSALRWTYEEIDPDVFGEELDTPAYAAVDRIAAVAACATVG